MSETPDATPTETIEPPAPATPRRASKSTGSSGRRGAGRGGAKASTGGRRATSRGTASARSGGAAASSDAASSLAAALRGLVGGIEEEVSAITALSEQIDTHVQALNELRSEATRRLVHLDDLRGAAEDVNLSAFLDTSIQPQLPQVEEEFPDRIYGG